MTSVSIDGVFFAAVHGERLYFKTSEASRERYEEMGMGPFRPRATVTLKSLYEVPVDILEDAGELTTHSDEEEEQENRTKLTRALTMEVARIAHDARKGKTG